MLRMRGKLTRRQLWKSMNMEWKEKESVQPAPKRGAGSLPARRSLSWSVTGKFSPRGGGVSPGGVSTNVSAACVAGMGWDG